MIGTSERLRRALIADGLRPTVDLAAETVEGKGDSFELSPEALSEWQVARRNGSASAHSTTEGPCILCLESVKPKKVEWLWPGRIPRGCITILDGDPGLGKSMVSQDIAARETRGALMPCESATIHPRTPGAVLFLNGEDDLARTVRPRLDAMCADLSRVFSLENIVTEGAKRPPMLPDDNGAIERIVTERGISLVVIDPLMGFLNCETTDSHKDSDIRRVLLLLRDMAERTQVAVLLVRHLNKLVNVSEAVYRGGGSIGIIGAARSALLIAKHPDDEESRVLGRTKGNLCAEPEPLTYRIAASDGQPPTIEWDGTTDIDFGRILVRDKTQQQQKRRDATIKANAAKILAALDTLDGDRKGITKRQARDHTHIGSQPFAAALTDLLADDTIETVPVTYPLGNGAVGKTVGIRRRPQK
jgi:hypothetical protein